MKFSTKPMWQDPPHLRHVATLPWEIKNSNFLQIFSIYGRKGKQIQFLIAFNFVSRSPYWLQIHFTIYCCFIYLLFVINFWHRKFVTSDVTAVFVNNQHGIQRRGQEFDKSVIQHEAEMEPGHGSPGHRVTGSAILAGSGRVPGQCFLCADAVLWPGSMDI